MIIFHRSFHFQVTAEVLRTWVGSIPTIHCMQYLVVTSLCWNYMWRTISLGREEVWENHWHNIVVNGFHSTEHGAKRWLHNIEIMSTTTWDLAMIHITHDIDAPCSFLTTELTLKKREEEKERKKHDMLALWLCSLTPAVYLLQCLLYRRSTEYYSKHMSSLPICGTLATIAGICWFELDTFRPRPRPHCMNNGHRGIYFISETRWQSYNRIPIIRTLQIFDLHLLIALRNVGCFNWHKRWELKTTISQTLSDNESLSETGSIEK